MIIHHPERREAAEAARKRAMELCENCEIDLQPDKYVDRETIYLMQPSTLDIVEGFGEPLTGRVIDLVALKNQLDDHAKRQFQNTHFPLGTPPCQKH